MKGPETDAMEVWAWAQMCCDQIKAETHAAIDAMDEMPGGMAEDAANLLCAALEEAKAQVLSWANDHGEP